MSEPLPGTVETPPTTTPDPEPEGVVEVQGQKMVPVSALVAERERARTSEREKLSKEYEPLKEKAAKADELAAQFEAARPKLQWLEQHPELLQPKQENIPSVSDEDAEKYARRYQLYTPTGLDLACAKQIIADNRAETQRIARETAQEAIAPYAQTTAQQASKSNFIWAARQTDQQGNPLVDPRVLAEEWAKLPAELTAQSNVAEWVLNAAIGVAHKSGRKAPAAPEHEPVFSEAPGGRQPSYQMGNIEKRLARVSGMSEKDFAERAKQYQPGAVNFLE